ncbi:hypothetical protein [Nocardia salmonicida]|uniref:hypothetical protein n=1 Tax=Nocardia salmonicida TaxID=53431 RepID=UPI0033FEFC93
MANASDDRRVSSLRGMLHRSASVQIARIEVHCSNVLAPQTIEFDRLTAIVGSHGAGKTLTLRLIEGLFGNVSQALAPPILPELGRDGNPFATALPNPITAVVSVTVIHNGVQLTQPIDISDGRAVNRKKWVDALGPCFAPEYVGVPSMLSWLFSFLQNYEEQLNIAEFHGYEVKSPPSEDFVLLRTYQRKDLDAVRNILGKAYGSLSSYGWTVDQKWQEQFPFVVAETVGGQRIDNFMMSLGELWTHWIFGRRFVDAEGWTLLLDEPESFLAQRGHRPFMDEVFRRCLEHDNQLVVATHSPQVLSNFPLNAIRLCLPSSEGIILAQAKSTSQIFDILGAAGLIKVVILVEDEMASRVLGDLVSEFDWSLARQLEIVIADGGGSVVIAGLNAMKNARESCYVAVLDGDYREKSIFPKKADLETVQYLTQSIFYLPGGSSPEEELLQAATEHASHLAQLLNREIIDIAAASASCADLDHQYWLSSYARALGLPQDVVRHSLVRVWLTTESVCSQAIELVHSLRTLVDHP